MTSEELIKQTQEQIHKLNRKGRRLPYPQFVKDAVIELSKSMTASSIAASLGISKTFTCKIARSGREQKRKRPLLNNTNDSNIQFIEITDQLKSVVKDDVETKDKLIPAMRFTTNSGIIIEVFS